MKQAGLDQTQIAQKVGVNKSTISREFRRNKGQRGWRPKKAQSLRDEHRGACINGRQFSLDDRDGIERLTREDLSPEQAADRLELEGRLQISHEAIYRHLYADKRDGGDLCQHLRGQKPYRKRYASGQERRGVLKGISKNPNSIAILCCSQKITPDIPAYAASQFFARALSRLGF